MHSAWPAPAPSFAARINSRMRFIGKLTTWHEERGFGFISPAEGGQDIFVHASELPRGFVPSPGEALTFEVTLNPQGKKQAVQVQQVNVARMLTPVTRDEASAREHVSHPMTPRRLWRTYVVLPVLLVLILVSAYRWNEQRSSAISQTVQRAAISKTPPLASPSQRCDGRTMCSQMTSCAEATYFLKNCPGTRMDGNNDGVPCEMQWCK